MVCDLNHRLAISEASVGRKRSCGQLALKVRGWVAFAIRWTRCFSDFTILSNDGQTKVTEVFIKAS
jgi:hypothetical protein